MAIKQRIVRWLQSRVSAHAEMRNGGFVPVTFYVIPSRSVELLVYLQKIGAKEVHQNFTGKVDAMCMMGHIETLKDSDNWPEFDFVIHESRTE